MAFFKTEKIEEIKVELEEPLVYKITEKNTVMSAILEIKNFQIVPVADILTGSLELSEGLEKINNEIMRTDFAIVPKRAVMKLSDGRIGFDSSMMHRLDDLIEFFRMHLEITNNKSNNNSYYNDVQRVLGGQLSVKRIVTTDGWEVYTVDGTEMIEAQSEVCRRCRTCNEMRPRYYHNETPFNENTHYWVTIRDLRKYVLHQQLLNVLYKTGVHIIEVKHPCEVRNLYQIMRIQHDVVGTDPPEMRIVFPVQQE